MLFKKQRDGDTLTYFLSGRLDADVAPVLEEKFESELAGIQTLIFDLEELTYISSSGLRGLLSAQKIMNSREGSMSLKNVAENIVLIMKATGFNKVLQIE